MFLNKQPKFRKGKPKVRVTQASPAPIGLTVSGVSDVSFDGPAGSLVVEFAVPAGASLNDPSGADPSKWTAVVGGTVYLGSGFVFDGGATMTITFSDYGSAAGPDVLNYAADPSDISDSAGQQLQAFENYPI